MTATVTFYIKTPCKYCLDLGCDYLIQKLVIDIEGVNLYKQKREQIWDFQIFSESQKQKKARKHPML